MPPQHRGAALLDGRHDLELPQTQVRVLSLTPGQPVGPEDIRDFQGRTPHGRRLGGVEALQRTDDLVQDLGGDLGVEGGGIELLVAEQNLDDADVHLLFQQVGGETVA
jgi:hypothetical protein